MAAHCCHRTGGRILKNTTCWDIRYSFKRKLGWFYHVKAWVTGLRNDNIKQPQVPKGGSSGGHVPRHLVLAVQSTALLDERRDDLRVPHHCGSVQGGLIPLQSNGGRNSSQLSQPCPAAVTALLWHKDICPQLEQTSHHARRSSFIRKHTQWEP